MSYSFSIKADTKDAAKSGLSLKFDETVIAFQPGHEIDRDAILRNANAAIDLMADPSENQQLWVSVSGSLGWITAPAEGEAPAIQNVSINVSVSMTPKE